VPQRKSGIKELHKNRTKRMHNLDIKTDLKKTIKKFLLAVKDKKAEDVKSGLNLAYKKLDKACKRNILKKNTTARRKSLLAKLSASIT
jgi:small subunit ribosomal protein S20